MNLDSLKMHCKLTGWFISDGGEPPSHLHLINQSPETIRNENYTRACMISIYYKYDPIQLQMTQSDREAKTETTEEILEINDEVIDTFLTYR